MWLSVTWQFDFPIYFILLPSIPANSFLIFLPVLVRWFCMWRIVTECSDFLKIASHLSPTTANVLAVSFSGFLGGGAFIVWRIATKYYHFLNISRSARDITALHFLRFLQQNKKPGGRARNTPARFYQQIRRKLQPKSSFILCKRIIQNDKSIFFLHATLAMDRGIWYTICTSAPEFRLVVMCVCT